MLHFYRLSEKKPEYNTPVLIKYKRYEYDWDNLKKVYAGNSYYVVQREEGYAYNKETGKCEYMDSYAEAGGECYWQFSEKNILGWCYLSDIEKVEEWN